MAAIITTISPRRKFFTDSKPLALLCLTLPLITICVGGLETVTVTGSIASDYRIVLDSTRGTRKAAAHLSPLLAPKQTLHLQTAAQTLERRCAICVDPLSPPSI